MSGSLFNAGSYGIGWEATLQCVAGERLVARLCLGGHLCELAGDTEKPNACSLFGQPGGFWAKPMPR
jgi:hypothetical protein